MGNKAKTREDLSQELIILKNKYKKLETGFKEYAAHSKKIEAELRKFSVAVEQSPVSIVITNLDGIIEYANPKACETTGYAHDELIGKNPRVLKSGETPSIEYKGLWDSITSGNQWHGLFHNKKKSGELYWESSTIAPILDSNGNITHFLAVKEDITKRKEAEDALLLKNQQLAELNATKDKFFSIISHDLRSPFTSILGFAGLLKNEIGNYTDEEIKNLVEIIYNTGKKTFELLENLLEWSRTQTGAMDYDPEELNLEEVVLNVISLADQIAKTKNISISYNIPANLSAFADLNMINTVLRNLTNNAIKFTHKNGFVGISAIRKTDEIEICVSDTGIGMSENIKDKLFLIKEKISTRGTENEKGTGIGLILCKELISKHNGKIWVESETGNGSVFKFTLPLNENR